MYTMIPEFDHKLGWYVMGQHYKDHYIKNNFSTYDSVIPKPLCNRSFSSICWESDLENDEKICNTCLKRLYELDPNTYFRNTIMWDSWFVFDDIEKDKKLQSLMDKLYSNT